MKKAILSCLMLVAGLTASAQEQKGTTEYVFEPHWYVQVQPMFRLLLAVSSLSFGVLVSQLTHGRARPVASTTVLVMLGLTRSMVGSGTTSLLLSTVH